MSVGQQDDGATRSPVDDDGGQVDLELDDVDIKDLLRKALDPPAKAPKTDILSGVQRRIRERSRGRFYADGWSTTLAPRATFLVTSVIMLGVAVLVWLLLGPVDLSAGG
jgi:hypothetical protein